MIIWRVDAAAVPGSNLAARDPELALYPIHAVRTHPLRGRNRALMHLLLAVLLCSPARFVGAASADESFRQGVALYDARKYEEAIVQFENAVSLAPQSSEYHHWLGKSYGRVAEHAVWYRALSLARRTRLEFETAVRLDEQNVDALRDLMQYYRQAPAFLGGSDRKAGAIEQRLKDLPAANAD